MSSSTALAVIGSANKIHRCSWCGTKISVGESYARYRWFDGGESATVKLHPECHAIMNDTDDLPLPEEQG